MKIGVVILNYNSIGKTINCINSFNKESVEDEFIFFIIDNNSTEKVVLEDYNYRTITEEEVESFEYNKKNNIIICKLEHNYGYSYGNNIGMKLAAKSNLKIAIVANPDTEAIDLKKLKQITQIDKDFLAIFPKVLDPNKKNQSIYIRKNALEKILGNVFFPIDSIINRLYRKYLIRKSYKTDIIKVDFSIGCFIVFNVGNFEAINGFDENMFLYNEEKVLCEKARKNRKNMYYSDMLIVKHNHIYQKMSEFEIKERKKSRKYYYKVYKKYSDFTILLIEITEDFRMKIRNKLKRK